MGDAIKQHLRRGQMFCDVGAHFGLWSLYAARIVGSTGRVLAYEPSAAFHVLTKNTRKLSQINRFDVAIGDRDVEGTFYGQGLSSGGSLSRAVTNINEHYAPTVAISAQPVRVRSLDSLSAEWRSDPALIKVDVEGYELKVLQGARCLIERAQPAWLIEIHPPQLRECGGTDQDCLRLLRHSGYSVEVIHRNPNSLYTVFAAHRGEARQT